jgi:hypothetical protein
MPELCRFYGIVIRMYFDDHAPPHFHAYYGESEVLITIHTLAVMAGKFPPRALGLVMEWAALHQDELRVAWDRARQLEPLGEIAPLA